MGTEFEECLCMTGLHGDIGDDCPVCKGQGIAQSHLVEECRNRLYAPRPPVKAPILGRYYG
jgi:hypothetical protein